MAAEPPRKLKVFLEMIRESPLGWFRDSGTDQRDLDLLRAAPVEWLQYGKTSFLRKIYHMKKGEEFGQTNWIVETDEQCKEIVSTAGGKLVGYGNSTYDPVQWASVTVNVNVAAGRNAGFDWGFLSTRPSNIRIFKGPCETCPLHTWDAMILRDCHANTEGIRGAPPIADRSFDILCMKMCEDFDHAWVVAAIKDVGPDNRAHDCQDSSACGCIF